jgi:uncharacterized protein (DUF433 family)
MALFGRVPCSRLGGAICFRQIGSFAMSPIVFVPGAEAAYIAGLSDRDMNRVFDEHLVPDQLVQAGPGHRFARLASAFARFYFTTDSIFAATLRRKVLAELTERVIVMGNKDRILALHGALAKSAWVVHVSHGQSVDVSPFVESATLRAREVDQAEAVVEASDDVMDGTPVFKGTRVPLDVVTASLDKGISFERVRAAYDFLTPELAEAAKVYQLVHPRRGRRRSIAEVHPDWKVTETRVVRPPRASTAA